MYRIVFYFLNGFFTHLLAGQNRGNG